MRPSEIPSIFAALLVVLVPIALAWWIVRREDRAGRLPDHGTDDGKCACKCKGKCKC